MIWKILKMTWFDWRNSWRTVLPVTLLYRFLATSLLLPFFSFLMNFIIAGSSPLNLFNEYVFKRLLQVSPLLALVGFLFLATIFIEQYCWLMLSYQNRHQGSFTFGQALRTGVRQLPKLWPLILLQSTLHFFVAFFVGSFLATSPLLNRFRFPTFVSAFLQDQPLLGFIYVVFLILLLWLYIRTLFLTSVAIETQASFRIVWRETKQLLHRGLLKQIGLFILIQAVLLVIGGGFAIVMQIVIASLLLFVPGLSAFQELLFFNAGIIMVATIWSALFVPLQAFAIQNFYAVSKHIKGKAYPFHAPKQRKSWLWSLATIAAIVSFLVMNVLGEQLPPLQPVIVAHRGSSTAPQNTLLAMETALAEGAQMLELDVQLTKDGVAVLEHDQYLTRAFSLEEKVSDLTYAQLKALDAGAYWANQPTTIKIATLAEVIALSEQTQTPLLIELKTYQAFAPELMEAVVAEIEAAQCQQRCFVASANYEQLQFVKQLNPNIQTFYVAYLALGEFATLNVDGFMIENTNLTKKAVQRVKAQGKSIYAWTVNTESEVLSAYEKGVDGIITDHVPVVRATYDQVAKEAEE